MGMVVSFHMNIVNDCLGFVERLDTNEDERRAGR